MRARWPLIGMAFGVATLVAPMVVAPSIRLVYNASDSAPRGWYRVSPATHFDVGDYVVTRLPKYTAALAAERGYLPHSTPLLKQIAAVGGQRVCVRDAVVSIDGVSVTRTLTADGTGRPLYAWKQCRMLFDDELFLLNPAHLGSFDSRYFGPIPRSAIIGQVVPLWTE